MDVEEFLDMVQYTGVQQENIETNLLQGSGITGLTVYALSEKQCIKILTLAAQIDPISINEISIERVDDQDWPYKIQYGST